LQTQFFVYFVGYFRVIDRKREHIREVQHIQFLHSDLDFAGGNLRVVGAGGTLADFSGDADDAFAAQRGGLIEKVLGQIGGIEDGLRATLAIANVDEDDAAQIAARMDPAG
jgi:hypothetical protein